jgi:mRNA (guanine-N7-)-methyltransferase
MGEEESASSLVAAHYNAIQPLGRENRSLSRVYHLRSLHNWLKSLLIASYTSEGHRVLDLCCGKGGDLPKWSRARVREVVGVDIAQVSVQQARERFSAMTRPPFRARFYAGDVFSHPLESLIGEQEPFDLVSCQFAYHYSWESETKARLGLQNISQALRSGGHFLATTPNANWIV